MTRRAWDVHWCVGRARIDETVISLIVCEICVIVLTMVSFSLFNLVSLLRKLNGEGSSVSIGVGWEVTLTDYDLCVWHPFVYGPVLLPQIPSSASRTTARWICFNFTFCYVNALLWNPSCTCVFFLHFVVHIWFTCITGFWALFTVLVPDGVYRPHFSPAMLKSMAPNSHSLTSDIIWHFSHFFAGVRFVGTMRHIWELEG